MVHYSKSAGQSQKKTSTRAAGFFLSVFGLVIIAALLILSTWAHQTVVVVVLGLVLSAAGFARLWSFLSLNGVSFERNMSDKRVFPGEHTVLKLRIANRKPLPLPWVEVAVELPSGFISDRPLSEGTRPGFEILSETTSLLWYSAISWKYRLGCNKRGYYQLGPLTVSSGDIFGFYPRTSQASDEVHLIVYPRLYPISRLAIPSFYPLGDAISEKRLFEDPSRTIGVRDYITGDSLRRIHWKASARQQQLQVKVFEPTTTLKVALFVAIDSFRRNGICQENDLELGISTAASLAKQVIETRSQAGIWVNSQLADSGQPARIAPGSGVAQLAQILEALAKVTTASSIVFSEFFQSERQNLPLGCSLIMVVSEISQDLNRLFADLTGSGYKLVVFQIGEVEDGRSIPDIFWYHVRQPSDLAEGNWMEKS